MKYFCLLIFLFFCTSTVFGQSHKIDSLENRLKNVVQDSLKIDLMNSLSFEYMFISPQKAEIHLQNARVLCEKTSYLKGELEVYNMQGLMYRIKGLYEQALNAHFKSLKICEKIDYKQGTAHNLGNIALVYSEQESYSKAIDYFLKALKIKEIIKDTNSIAFSLNDIAATYLNLKDYKKSLEYNVKALEINKIIKNKGGIAYSLFNIGNIYFLTQEYQKAEESLLKSEKLCQETDNYYVHVQTTNVLANLYETLKQYSQARDYALKSIKIASQYQMKKDIKNAAQSLAKIYANLNDYPSAYRYQNLFIAYKDSLNSLEIEKKTALLSSQYEYEQKENLLKIQHAQQISEQRWIIFSAIVALFLMIIIAFLILNSRIKLQKTYKNLERANQEILQQKEEINQQKEEILLNLATVEQQSYEIYKKNLDFKNSITYALRIQNAILPAISEIKKHFPENFVFFRPRDIVSGDFYWFADKIDRKIFVVADCTGHGVSGAFMTMIGNNILNQIIHDYEIHEPDQILNLMPVLLAKTLYNSEKQVKDGMDISILTFETKNDISSKNVISTVCYAGAMNPLYYVQNKEFKEIKANKTPISSNKKDDFDYKKHEIVLDSESTLYLCSDGFQDQFGGEHDKKFMVKRFKKLLLEISDKPMAEQKQVLEQTFYAWKGKEKQTDDVLVMGIRI